MRYTHWTSAVLLVGMVATATKAQEWCPPGAEWSHGYYSVNWSTGETHTGVLLSRYAGDTVMGGETVHRIKRDLHYQVTGDAGYVHQPWSDAYTRSEGPVVYAWMGGGFDTLLWSSAVPGDRWSVPGYGEPEYFYLVTDTATVLFEGIPLRRTAVSMIYEPYGPAPVAYDTLYERTGSTEFSVFDPPHPGADGIHLFFRCYRDDDLSIAGPVAQDCGFTVAVDNIMRPLGLSVYPNPGTGHVRFAGANTPLMIKLHDLSGRILLQQLVPDPTQGLDLSQLPPGVYVMRLQHATGQAVFAKWVKE